MPPSISLAQLFTEARSQKRFVDRPLPGGMLEELYDLLKWGPTSMNCCPSRFTFVQTREARDQLAGCASEGNRDRIRNAPATVVIATDPAFYEQMDQLVPHNPGAGERFRNDTALAEATAFRNGTLQGAYLIMAARALGLDCAPMSGFDADAVNQTFFNQLGWRANFLCCLGYGDPDALHPRAPRLDFAAACRVL